MARGVRCEEAWLAGLQSQAESRSVSKSSILQVQNARDTECSRRASDCQPRQDRMGPQLREPAVSSPVLCYVLRCAEEPGARAGTTVKGTGSPPEQHVLPGAHSGTGWNQSLGLSGFQGRPWPPTEAAAKTMVTAERDGRIHVDFRDPLPAYVPAAPRGGRQELGVVFLEGEKPHQVPHTFPRHLRGNTGGKGEVAGGDLGLHTKNLQRPELRGGPVGSGDR